MCSQSNSIINNYSQQATDSQPQITIKICDEIFLSSHAEELANLCRKAFHEHATKDINFGPITMTTERFCQRIKGNIGIYAELDGKIIGFNNARPDYDEMTVYGDITAIDPEYKGKHIGSTLKHTFIKYLISKNFKLFITDTSLKAPHVVKFHKSYGCKAVGITHFHGRNYYSVILRLALNPQYEISNFKAKWLFLISSLKCKAMIKENGDKTLMAKLLDKYTFSRK